MDIFEQTWAGETFETVRRSDYSSLEASLKLLLERLKAAEEVVERAADHYAGDTDWRHTLEAAEAYQQRFPKAP